MGQTYLIWIKPVDSGADFELLERSLVEVEGVGDATITVLPAMAGVSRKEVLMAVSLSVTANFVTDGLKLVFSKLTEDESNKVVYCRRPDGEEIPVGDLLELKTDPRGTHGE